MHSYRASKGQVDMRTCKTMYCIIDTETTGLDPDKNALISIAALFVPDLKSGHVQASIDLKVNPGDFEIEEEALKVNGLRLEDIKKYPTRSHVADRLKDIFLHWALPYDKLIPVGHNYQFDMRFLSKLIGADTYNACFSHHYLDTMLFAQYLRLRDPSYTKSVSLNALRDRYGISKEGSHTALKDAQDTLTILRNMVYEV